MRMILQSEGHVWVSVRSSSNACSRILRQENYLIALFNKDLLDLRVRIPAPKFLLDNIPASLVTPLTSDGLPTTADGSHERRYIVFGANTLTKALEWNLRFCLMGYLFDARGQVRKEFIRERKRKDLVLGQVFYGNEKKLSDMN
jgi:autophagy-related protein 9